MRCCENQPPALYFPGLKQLSCGRAGYTAQPTCHFYSCFWLRPHRGEFAKTAHSVELGIWYRPLWLYVCALTGRFVVIEISQVSCCLSLKVSQPEGGAQPKATSGGKARGRSSEGSQPWAVIMAVQEITVSFGGGLYHFSPTPPVPQRLTWKAVRSLHLSRGNSAQPAEPLNSAGPLPASFTSFPCRLLGHVGFYWGKIRFFKKVFKVWFTWSLVLFLLLEDHGAANFNLLQLLSLEEA